MLLADCDATATSPPTQAWMFLLSYSLVLSDGVVMCLNFVQRSVDYARGVAVTAMDGLLVLAPSRWTLGRAVEAINEELSALNLEQHPDKTFIGYIVRGFDFLGYRFGLNGLVGLARQTIVNFETKLSRLYEQLRQANREWRQSFEMQITTYINRFCGWATGGLNDAIGLDWKTGRHLPPGVDVFFGCRGRFHR